MERKAFRNTFLSDIQTLCFRQDSLQIHIFGQTRFFTNPEKGVKTLRKGTVEDMASRKFTEEEMAQLRWMLWTPFPNAGTKNT